MRTKFFQSYNFSVMKLRQLHKKSVSGARKVTSMVKPLQSLHLGEFAVALPVGAGAVRKVTEAQHARAEVKGKREGLGSELKQTKTEIFFGGLCFHKKGRVRTTSLK